MAYAAKGYDPRAEARDSALSGFFLTAAPCPWLALMFMLLDKLFGLDIRTDAVWLILAMYLFLGLGMHWAFAGFLGRGPVARMRQANLMLLAAPSASIALDLIYNDVFGRFRYLCHEEGIRDDNGEFGISFGGAYYIPSDCERYLAPITDPIETAIFPVIPLGIFVAATIWRVVESRRKDLAVA